MGTGDWNDGMNKVGAGGQGESVWVGWFLLTCLRQFAEVAQRRGERDRAGHYRAQAERLRVAIEEQGWDGRWYRRAYFDDGTPLGSQQNEECRIDSLVQSWAVLSGAADPERARQGMAAVDEQLVRRDDKLILLFTPPFDQGTLQPGYIKGYVPGIRENGGQYTHAAIWVVQATAQLGQGTQAVELFDLLNPIHHAAKAEDVGRYRVEPYVVAADVYSQPPHTGRGGWTWYTGSAGWLYRVGLEAILGFGLRGSRLVLNPCIARQWPGFEITYRYRSATYHITVDNPHGVECGVRSVTVDGQARPGAVVELADDGRRHEVRVVLGLSRLVALDPPVCPCGGRGPSPRRPGALGGMIPDGRANGNAREIMSVTIDLSPETEKRLAELAARSGQSVQRYLEQLVERETRAGNGSDRVAPTPPGVSAPGVGMTVDEALAPFRRQVQESGLTDEELRAFFEEVREEVWRERQAKPGQAS
jgi:hypothetical protein